MVLPAMEGGEEGRRLGGWGERGWGEEGAWAGGERGRFCSSARQLGSVFGRGAVGWANRTRRSRGWAIVCLCVLRACAGSEGETGRVAKGRGAVGRAGAAQEGGGSCQ